MCKRIFLNENIWIANTISLKYVPWGLIDDMLAWVQIMAWRRPGDKSLSKTMLTQVTDAYMRHWGGWVNGSCVTNVPLFTWQNASVHFQFADTPTYNWRFQFLFRHTSKKGKLTNMAGQAGRCFPSRQHFSLLYSDHTRTQSVTSLQHHNVTYRQDIMCALSTKSQVEPSFHHVAVLSSDGCIYSLESCITISGETNNVCFNIAMKNISWQENSKLLLYTCCWISKTWTVVGLGGI